MATRKKSRRRIKRYKYYIVPLPKGGANKWAVKRAGNVGYSAKLSTQSEALERARELASRHSRAQIIIQGRNGRIRREITLGADPRNIPG